MNKYWTLVFLTLLSGCRKQDANYVVVKYEWGASKSIANVSTALYTIHHGDVLIEAECIGTSANNVFVPSSCSPPLPVGTTLSMERVRVRSGPSVSSAVNPNLTTTLTLFQ